MAFMGQLDARFGKHALDESAHVVATHMKLVAIFIRIVR
jgi:hypothetical protein